MLLATFQTSLSGFRRLTSEPSVRKGISTSWLAQLGEKEPLVNRSFWSSRLSTFFPTMAVYSLISSRKLFGVGFTSMGRAATSLCLGAHTPQTNLCRRSTKVQADWMQLVCPSMVVHRCNVRECGWTGFWRTSCTRSWC